MAAEIFSPPWHRPGTAPAAGDYPPGAVFPAVPILRRWDFLAALPQAGEPHPQRGITPPGPGFPAVPVFRRWDFLAAWHGPGNRPAEIVPTRGRFFQPYLFKALGIPSPAWHGPGNRTRSGELLARGRVFQLYLF